MAENVNCCVHGVLKHVLLPKPVAPVSSSMSLLKNLACLSCLFNTLWSRLQQGVL